MNPSRRRRDVVLAIAAILLWGCGSAVPSPSPSSRAAALPSASSLQPTAPASAVESTPSDATPSAFPIDEGDPPGLDTLLGATLVTVSDRIRVRSEPGISDDSIKYEPLLPLGTSLYSFSGPVFESGYEWYEVASVSVGLTAPGCDTPETPCQTISSGWAARSGRDGEPWLVPGEAECPPVPTDVQGVQTATFGARLACFSGVPITLRARLISCNCDVDGGGFDPFWFGGGSEPNLLADPSETRPPESHEQWLVAALDPAGRHPPVLPLGEIVEVTGMFDHPAAQGCLYQGVPTDIAGPPTPTSACRFVFVTTSIAAVD